MADDKTPGTDKPESDAGNNATTAPELGKNISQDGSSLYDTPKDALKALLDSYYYWGEKLTDNSFALSLAVIAANWAVFGSIDQIRGNIWSELSIVMVLLMLGINLIGMKRLGEAHRQQIEYAEAKTARWKSEFEKARNTSCAWPSTDHIDSLARRLRTCRTFLPLVGGALFITALVVTPPKAKAKANAIAIEGAQLFVSPTPAATPVSPAAPTATP